MEKKLRCLIVDDEKIAREGLAEYVNDIDFLELVGTAENPIEAMKIIEENHVDLLFLDIHMPKMSGIDFLKVAKNIPKTILTTAYSEFAVQSYELDVIDYLLKPISIERFTKACKKVKEKFFLTKKEITLKDDSFFLKGDKKFEKINYNEIIYIESLQNYIIIHTSKKKIISYINLKDMHNHLDGKPFIQIHKSFIVALNKIDYITRENVTVQNQTLPIGRTYADYVLNEIVTKNLLKK